jgi:putative nucleotidyltransferase with HDIG domain
MQQTVPDATEPSGIRLAELLGALSQALDITEGQPEGHCIRCCWIGINVGRELGLSDPEIWELYYTLLLKDLGCSSNAARICQLYLTDDLSFKHDYKSIGDRLPQVLGFVLSHTGMKAGLAERFRAIINILQNGGEIARELVETRCQQGAQIARQMHFSENVARGIQSLDEHWDGKGKPERLEGTAIPLYARIALLAQVVDVMHSSVGPVGARREVNQRSGTWFDPDVVAAFERVAEAADFWSTLIDPDLPATVLAMEPGQQEALVDDDYLDDIAAAFGKVVDAKSPYTSGHCERVTLFADMIAEEMGFDAEHRRKLRRAALLHDIGKLGVSNSVLDKPGKLDDAEWAQMRRHPTFSEEILSRITAFADIARVGHAHHERLDGKGYPRGVSAEAIDTDTRIVTTADIFDALTADRPYRPAMPVSKALEIMRDMVGTALDPLCVDALIAGLDRLTQAEATAA